MLVELYQEKLYRDLPENGWYIKESDESVGPFTTLTLQQMVRLGVLLEDSEVRKGWQSYWYPLN
jgi:hypothetical protein